ncbi:MAG: glycosyltransferase [Mucilaginibacter sp.]|nr:glycosyltransferase [Mucilaginibacter sp.]
MAFLGYSIFMTTWWILLVIYLLIKTRQIKSLSEQPITNDKPALAIIIAVRNEEEDLEKALHSVCNINYQNYRIIVVNDRSTDCTAEILEEFASRYPQLIITTITTLPNGWLGKNNALYQGYLSSTEEWLLFTDADVEFHPDAVSKALNYSVKNKLDHLCVLPHVVSRSQALNSMLGTFTLMMMLQFRPWDVSNPKSRAFIGIGAFNLINRDAYEKIGTHKAIRLRPDDDLKLGYTIKKHGLRSDALSGEHYICLEWYKSISQFINGLMKNAFAVTDYNVTRVIVGMIITFLLFGLPVPLMLICGNLTIRLMATVIILFQMIYMLNPALPNKWWHALTIPFATTLVVYIIVRATWLTLKQGGIYWRDTFYSLAMLKGES